MNLHKFANYIFLGKSELRLHRSAVTLAAADSMSILNKVAYSNIVTGSVAINTLILRFNSHLPCNQPHFLSNRISYIRLCLVFTVLCVSMLPSLCTPTGTLQSQPLLPIMLCTRQAAIYNNQLTSQRELPDSQQLLLNQSLLNLTQRWRHTYIKADGSRCAKRMDLYLLYVIYMFCIKLTLML